MFSVHPQTIYLKPEFQDSDIRMQGEARIRDLISTIFSWLPVESLIRFKCLNKECNEIISNPKFAAAHAARFPPKLHGFFCFFRYQPQNVVYIPLHYSHQNPKPTFFTAFPSIHTSCNGLFLHVPSQYHQASEFFTLFNPTTKRFRLIPPPKPQYYTIGSNVDVGQDLALAYDPINLSPRHDFKIVHAFVAALDLERQSQFYGFLIFSSNSTHNSWRKSRTTLNCSKIGEISKAQAVYLDGWVHWIRQCGDIVAFNVKTEEARLIPMPRMMRKPWFGVANGVISLVYLITSELVVWVLHDYHNYKWGCVRFRVASLPSKNPLYVIFFDGQWVGLMDKKNRSVIHMYNIISSEWKNIEVSHQQEQEQEQGQQTTSPTCYDYDYDDDVYIPFIPTIVEMNGASTADPSVISVKVARSTPNSNSRKQHLQPKRRKIVQDLMVDHGEAS